VRACLVVVGGVGEATNAAGLPTAAWRSTQRFGDLTFGISLVYLPIAARKRLGKHVPAAKYTCNNRRIVGRVVFYTARVVSKENLWICLYVPSVSACTAKAVVWRLPEPPDSEISERRVIVLARASSNSVDWTRLYIPVLLLGNGSVNIPAATKNCWTSLFICSACCIKGE
jgi:hypothetical protein